MVAKHRLRVACTPEQETKIKEELALLHQEAIDSDTRKRTVVSREKLIEKLGRTPSYIEALVNAMYFRRGVQSSGADVHISTRNI